MKTRPKILLVDDDALSITFFENTLKGHDVDFVRALSGEEAIEKCEKEEFALALVDVHMPGIDGYEAVKQIRKDIKHIYLPVIFFSAVYSENYYADKGLESGAVDFITKPVIPEILNSKVGVFLQLHEQKQKRIELIKKLRQTNKQLECEIRFRQKLESKLVEAKEEAEESERLKTAFLANMSHEIRTPMNAIVGFTDLLLEDDFDAFERREFIEIIRSSSNSLLNIIDDIIDLSKIESGQMKIVKKKCDINKLLAELEAYYNADKLSGDKQHIQIKTSTPEENEKVWIVTDPFRLKQILDNLIGNAIKFTNSGVVEFGYRYKDSNIEFFVKDTGIGIPKDKINLVFERFIQVDQSSTRNYGGTGLGLAISRNLARLLGGNMWVESELGKYTIFYFTIPKLAYKDGKVVSDPPPKTGGTYDWHGKVFLIVEDNVSNYLFLEASLKRTGATILWARDGVEALDMVTTEEQIDLILLDIQLPNMSGYEAAEKIKSIRKDIKIIAQTAYVMNSDIEKCKKSGCDYHLGKPINAVTLRETISKFVN